MTKIGRVSGGKLLLKLGQKCVGKALERRSSFVLTVDLVPQNEHTII